MKITLDWWFTHRLDKSTGLITAVFEETFIPLNIVFLPLDKIFEFNSCIFALFWGKQVLNLRHIVLAQLI